VSIAFQAVSSVQLTTPSRLHLCRSVPREGQRDKARRFNAGFCKVGVALTRNMVELRVALAGWNVM